jgi:tetratricopeptide (TPR) repeat protein
MGKDTLQVAPRLEQAKRYHAAGRLAEAELLFRKVLSDEPGNAEALHALGILMGSRGDFPRAIEALEEAIVIAPKCAHYYTSLASLLVQLGDWDRANECYQTSLYIQPLNAGAIEALADLAERRENYFDAIRYWQDALSLTRNRGEVLRRLARVLTSAGLVDDACAAYDKARDVRPYDARLAKEYADLLLSCGRNAVCEEVLCDIHSYYPFDPDIRRRLGVLYFRNEMYDEALAAFEVALEVAPHHRQTLIDYAVCLKTMGDDRSAEQVLRRIEAVGRAEHGGV